ncbi:hypothetical protein CH263_24590 [Rhodococcus sp. 06-1059B-a]|nr:hypothetical protein [Rhodococcus sp. 06-1059B-a]OZD58439.1 hypothetical protein CH263_24590 [Rhodococcus sp. 06-1059B-a]
MWKLPLWFAVLGCLIAVLGSGAGDIAFGPNPPDIFDGGTSLVVRYYGPGWGQLWRIAVVGAVLGALIGGAAHLAGVRMTTTAGHRVGRVVGAGLVGVALGLVPVWVLLADALSEMQVGYSVAVETVSMLTLYGISAVLAYGAALLLIWLALRAAGDGLRRRATMYVAFALPAGGIIATACGVGTAALFDFSTRPYTIVASTLVVMLVLSGTFAAARVWAVRSSSPGRAAGPAAAE